jgi:hypothetical protein
MMVTVQQAVLGFCAIVIGQHACVPMPHHFVGESAQASTRPVFLLEPNAVRYAAG